MVSLAARIRLPSRRSTTVILFTTCLGVFIAQLDSQVVNLAIKHIGSDLNAGISRLQWVMDSYNLFYATLLLTGGTLGDLYGRVRIFAIGIGLIVLGSIVCGCDPCDGAHRRARAHRDRIRTRSPHLARDFDRHLHRRQTARERDRHLGRL
jgi:hypothetical protein